VGLLFLGSANVRILPLRGVGPIKRRAVTPLEETERFPQTSLRLNTMVGTKLTGIFSELFSIPIWPLILFGQEAVKVTGRAASVDGAAIAGAKVVLGSSNPRVRRKKASSLRKTASEVTVHSFQDAATIPRSQPLDVRRLNMKQLRWTLFHLRLWLFELKLWMDGLSWEQVYSVAERSKDLARATHERS
jgi:hypothetical protein